MPDLRPFTCLQKLAYKEKPILALALGSGLAAIAGKWRALLSVPFSEIAGLSAPSVPGHKGCMTLAKCAGKSVLLLEGRLHLYEGHSREAIAQPLRLAHFLGARIFFSTNAAGGIDPRLQPGSFMLIRDHIDWTQPAAGKSVSGWFECATESSLYSPRLMSILQQEAERLSIDLLPGNYAAVSGPNYETPAEIRALRSCGADAVGMSTIHEVRAAQELGLECVAISCITNRAAGLDSVAEITHEEVLQTADAASHHLAPLIEACIEEVA